MTSIIQSICPCLYPKTGDLSEGQSVLSSGRHGLKNLKRQDVEKIIGIAVAAFAVIAMLTGAALLLAGGITSFSAAGTGLPMIIAGASLIGVGVTLAILAKLIRDNRSK